MTSPVRVVIAGDHPMFRYGLGAVLAASADVEVVGAAADGRQLLTLVEQHLPSVVLTDLAMPGLDGTTAAHEIKARFPTIGVLVLTMHEDDESLFGALRAGARGYLLKGADREEIERAVLSVASGAAVYSAVVARSGIGSSPAPTRPMPRRSSQNSRAGNARSWTWWPRGCAIMRSPAGSFSPRRPCATTSRPS